MPERPNPLKRRLYGIVFRHSGAKTSKLKFGLVMKPKRLMKYL